MSISHAWNEKWWCYNRWRFLNCDFITRFGSRSDFRFKPILSAPPTICSPAEFWNGPKIETIISSGLRLLNCHPLTYTKDTYRPLIDHTNLLNWWNSTKGSNIDNFKSKLSRIWINIMDYKKVGHFWPRSNGHFRSNWMRSKNWIWKMWTKICAKENFQYVYFRSRSIETN